MIVMKLVKLVHLNMNWSLSFYIFFLFLYKHFYFNNLGKLYITLYILHNYGIS